MEEKEILTNESEKEKQSSLKWTLVKFLIVFLVGAVMAGLIFVAHYYNEIGTHPDFGESFVRYGVDAFGLSGLLLILFAAISLVSSQGAFDMLNYSVQLVFFTVFRPVYREKEFPKTYYDYKVKMGLKKRKPVSALWIVGLLFLLVGVIFLVIYHNSIKE